MKILIGLGLYVLCSLLAGVLWSLRGPSARNIDAYLGTADSEPYSIHIVKGDRRRA